MLLMIPAPLADVMTAVCSGVLLGKADLTCYCIRHAETISKDDH
jgi:hypothetical protein